MTAPVARILRRRLAASIAVVAALALSACGSGGTRAGGEAGQKAPSKIVIATSGDYLPVFAPLWAAWPEFDKIEKKYRTSISYQGFAKGPDALAAVIGGSAEICNCGASTGLTAAVAGKHLTYVGTLYAGSGQVIVGAKKYESSRGNDLSKYTGARVGYSAEGSTSQLYLKQALASSGVPWGKIDGIALGGTSAGQPALASGRIDLIMMGVDAGSKAIHDGAGYVVADLNIPEVAEPLLGSLVGAGLVVPGTFRKSYPELSQDLVNALVAGLNRVRLESDPGKAYDLMSSEFKKTNSDKAAFARQWQFLHSAYASTDGTVSEQEAADTASTTTATRQQLNSPTAKAFFDNSLVLEAYQQLGISRPPVGN